MRGGSSRSHLAIMDMERLGCNPVEELYAALKFSKDMTLKGGNYDSTGKTDQSNWAALWLRAAESLTQYKHPKLTSVVLKADDKAAKILNTAEALKVLADDPFSKQAIKEVNKNVVDAMSSQIKVPFLPLGNKDE